MSEDQVSETSLLLKICCEERNGEALISEYCLSVIKVMVFSLTLPAAIDEVGLGQDVVLWGDFLAQNDISQQRLHTYNLKDIKSETISTETFNISSCILNPLSEDGHLPPETVDCWRCRAAG